MGCLFGYCGRPAAGLLERMARRLAHRCAGGFERVSVPAAGGKTAAIGRGRAPWSRQMHTWHNDASGAAGGYAGVLLNVASHTGEPPPALLAGLAENAQGRIIALEGAFVLALFCDDILTLARDPAGVKVLYWTCHPHRLVFASEIKALFADPLVPRRLRAAALPEYLAFSFIPGERTMFENIFELQPGSLLRFQAGRAQVRRYFVFEDREPSPGTEADAGVYVAQLRRDLEQSVAECCRFGAAPPPVLVSGGIDSSAVLAVLARQRPETIPASFSVHFGERYANENEFVALITDRCQTRHTWIGVRPRDFLKRLERIVWYLDDPIGDPVTVPNFLMAEAVSRYSPVVLNGEGGDPCFGGPKNIPMLIAAYLGPPPGDSADGWLERSYLAAFQRCFADLERMLDPAVWRAAGGEAALIEILRPFFSAPHPRSMLNRLMSLNIRLKGANLILPKVEKMTSANGVLALSPLFSRRIIEFSMACPPGLKLAGSVEKAVLKQAVADIVPSAIVARPKSGMMVPVKFWFRGEMRRYARRLLNRRRLGRIGLFNPDYVQGLFDGDRRGVPAARCGLKLWMLMTFCLWHAQMIEGKDSGD